MLQKNLKEVSLPLVFMACILGFSSHMRKQLSWFCGL